MHANKEITRCAKSNKYFQFVVEMKTRIFTVFIIILLFAPNAYSQISFEIDSLGLQTISDFHYDSPYVMDNIYEGVMVEGPIVYIYGRLRNDSEEGIIIDAFSYDVSDNIYHGIAHMEFNSIFDYRGQPYETEQEKVLYDLDISSPFLSTDPKFFKHAIVDNERVNIVFLGPGDEIAVNTDSHFLKNSKFCRLKEELWRQKHFHYTVREGKKLERIAFEVFSTIRIAPKVVIEDEEMYNRISNSAPDL